MAGEPEKARALNHHAPIQVPITRPHPSCDHTPPSKLQSHAPIQVAKKVQIISSLDFKEVPLRGTAPKGPGGVLVRCPEGARGRSCPLPRRGQGAFLSVAPKGPGGVLVRRPEGTRGRETPGTNGVKKIFHHRSDKSYFLCSRESSSVVELHLAKVAVAGSSPVSRSNFPLVYRRHSQAVRQRSAKPSPPVQIWVPPPFFTQ